MNFIALFFLAGLLQAGALVAAKGGDATLAVILLGFGNLTFTVAANELANRKEMP